MKRLAALLIVFICLALALPAGAGNRIKYSGVSRSASGSALTSATVSVYLGGTSTPANVYTASTGGASVTSVTSDSGGRWTFYVDTDDYGYVQTFKIVATKDGYTTVSEDNLHNVAFPPDAAGYLYSDGAGGYSWVSAIGDVTAAGDNTFTGTNTFKNTVTLKTSGGDTIMVFPGSAPTTSKSGIPLVDDAGASTWIEPTEYCVLMGIVGGNSFACATPANARANLDVYPHYGTLTTGHVVVWFYDDVTDPANPVWKQKAGDLPIEDNTTDGEIPVKTCSGEPEVCTMEGAEASDFPTLNQDTTGSAAKLPVDAATDATGKESLDSTTGQHRTHDGVRQNVFSPIQFVSFVITAPADTDDINIMKAPYGMTILGIDCIVQGTTSVTGQIQECTSAGASCTDLDSDITCDADGAADDGTLTDSTIASGAWLRWKTTSLSGAPTFLTVTVRYRVVAD